MTGKKKRAGKGIRSGRGLGRGFGGVIGSTANTNTLGHGFGGIVGGAVSTHASVSAGSTGMPNNVPGNVSGKKHTLTVIANKPKQNVGMNINIQNVSGNTGAPVRTVELTDTAPSTGNGATPARTVEFKSGIMSIKTMVDAPQVSTSVGGQDEVLEKVVNVNAKASALQGCCEYALLITEQIRSSIANGYPVPSAKQRIYRRDFWHKFVITNGCKYYKDFILKLILEQFVRPFDLIPVMYQKSEPNTFFYARNCGMAVEKLCRLNFTIPTNTHASGSTLQQPIQLQLVLTAVPLTEIPGIVQEKAVQSVLEKRYNVETKHLNLKDFHNDPSLSAVVFLPLSQPNILNYIMNYVKSGKYVAAESISLADNELSKLKPLEVLWNFKSLRSLNLGYNKIANFEELQVLKEFPLTDLVLDNNPLCQAFTSEAPYIKKATEFMPSLKTLDGCPLGNLSGMPLACRNFLVSPDGGPLTDQFLQHFFTLYDGSNRRKLLGVYHSHAIFSMTALYLPGQSTSASARLTEYMVHSRNLQKLSDYSKAQHLMICGAENVIRHLCRLPKTEHDPYTFTVDMANYSVDNEHKFASIMVCGVFREPNSLIRAFTRTFILRCVATDEWQITNEMLHVTNARTDDAKNAFRLPLEPAVLPKVTVLNREDKEQMKEILAQLTDMNSNWALKCLEDVKWDFKDALITFAELYKLGQIPVEAFTK